MFSSLRILFAAVALLVCFSFGQASSAITSVTVASINIDNYRYGGSTAKLRVYASESFFNGGAFVAGSAPGSGTWFKQIDCTVTGTLVSVPSFTLIITTTAPTNKSSRYTFMWVDSKGVERDAYLSDIAVPDTLGSFVTWEQLQVYNAGVAKPNNPTYPNTDQVSALITQRADGIFSETPSGSINGINQTFTLARAPIAGSVQVFLNGTLQKQGNCSVGTECYTISGAIITHALPPQLGDVLIVNYRTTQGLVGNGTIPTQIQEGGGFVLSIGAIADNLCLVRSATTIVGVSCSAGGGGGGGGLQDPGANGIIKRTAVNTTVPAVVGVDYLTPSGDGAALTNLNAASLASGTIPDARFPAALPAISGLNLTNLNASNLGSGTVPAARLGSGSPNSNTVLHGDQVWRTIVPPGSDTQVVFNDGGLFGGDADFIWNKNTNSLTIGTAGGTINSAGTLLVNPSGLTFDVAGNQIDPATNYDQNLGQPGKKFLSAWIAELNSETLVAQNSVATIGGRILVAPSTPLIADLSAVAVQIDVKYNNLANGDRIYLETNGQLEFMAVTSAGSPISGGFRYSVTRNLDGTGANQWFAGDAVVNTGTNGSGFIDLYSVRGVKSSSQVGPTIVGNVRNSSTYDDWSENWAVGNLKGLYGYGSDTAGVAFGKYSAGTPHITIDSTNGYRIFSGLSTVVGQWDNTGNITVGQVASGQSNVLITAGAFSIRNNLTERIKLNSDGSGFLANANISWNASGSLTVSGSASIAGWTVNSSSLTSGTVTIAGNSDVPGTGPFAWFGKSATGYNGWSIQDSTGRFISAVVGHPSTTTQPYLVINDATRYRIAIGGLNFAWGSDGATNSMGMKIWNSSGNKLVEFSDVQNTIGGWTISATNISSSGIDIHSTNGIFLTQGTNTWNRIKWKNAGGTETASIASQEIGSSTLFQHFVNSNTTTADGVYQLTVGSQTGSSSTNFVVTSTSSPNEQYAQLYKAGSGTLKGLIIGNSTVPTAMLDVQGNGLFNGSLTVSGTTSFLKVPTLTSTQRDALTASNGMVIYNTTTDKLQVRAAGVWVDLH